MSAQGIHIKDLRLLVIGPNGSGKSSLSNSILGKENQDKSYQPSLLKEEENVRFDRKIKVVDVPCLTDENAKHIYQVHMDCLKKVFPGPDAIILTIRVHRVSTDDKTISDCFKLYECLMDKSFYGQLIIMFTGKDELDRNKITLKEFIRSLPRNVRDVIEEYDIPHFDIDNQSTNDDQIKKIIDTIEDIKKKSQFCESTFFKLYLKFGILIYLGKRRLSKIISRYIFPFFTFCVFSVGLIYIAG